VVIEFFKIPADAKAPIAPVLEDGYILVVVTSSGILKAKQKIGITFNSDKLGGIDFTKIQNWPCAVPRRKPRH
jgi:hypothetical protein